MRAVLYLATAMIVMGLAFWAYHVNYATQARQGELRAVNRDIASLQEGLSVLRAEWAYLNRPDRLRDLVNLNFAALELLPMSPDQFGAVAEVAYPDPNADQTETKPGLLDDLAPIDVVAPPAEEN
ncbi:MAG: cell division protein FtsL [Paenirhodobacter sp.]|uniref:cell division protein FtsL n=1 Tax=Paenirhodobacter sp. TaxID=1965326 RepID=UPI003D109B0A